MSPAFSAHGDYEIWKHDNYARVTEVNTVRLDNRGHVYGDIRFCDMCSAYIKNSGVIDGVISAKHVTQMITNADEVTYLNVDGLHDIVVTGRTGINIYDVMNIAGGADSVRLDNASISISSDSATWFSDGPNIVLSGSTFLNLAWCDVYDGMLLLNNVSGHMDISVYGIEMDGIFLPTVFIKGNGVYLRLTRDTDYVRVMGVVPGAFLRSLRATNPTNQNLAALDAAKKKSDADQLFGNADLDFPAEHLHARLAK